MVYISTSVAYRPKINMETKIETGLTIRVRNGKLFSLFLSKTYVVGTQKNRLNETVLLSTLHICLN